MELYNNILHIDNNKIKRLLFKQGKKINFLLEFIFVKINTKLKIGFRFTFICKVGSKHLFLLFTI